MRVNQQLRMLQISLLFPFNEFNNMSLLLEPHNYFRSLLILFTIKNRFVDLLAKT